MPDQTWFTPHRGETVLHEGQMSVRAQITEKWLMTIVILGGLALFLSAQGRDFNIGYLLISVLILAGYAIFAVFGPKRPFVITDRRVVRADGPEVALSEVTQVTRFWTNVILYDATGRFELKYLDHPGMIRDMLKEQIK